MRRRGRRLRGGVIRGADNIARAGGCSCCKAGSAGATGFSGAVGLPSDSSVCRSTISAAFRSGTPPGDDDGADSDAREDSRKSPEFLKAAFTSLPLRFSSRSGRSASNCAIACCSFGESASEPATALRFANSGARLPCRVAALCAAAETASACSGVGGFFNGIASAIGFAPARTGATSS